MWVGGWLVGGGMRANTETSRSSARARAATTMSIKQLRGSERRPRDTQHDSG